jgi:hypothetical protein
MLTLANHGFTVRARTRGRNSAPEPGTSCSTIIATMAICDEEIIVDIGATCGLHRCVDQFNACPGLVTLSDCANGCAAVPASTGGSVVSNGTVYEVTALKPETAAAEHYYNLADLDQQWTYGMASSNCCNNHPSEQLASSVHSLHQLPDCR